MSKPYCCGSKPNSNSSIKNMDPKTPQSSRSCDNTRACKCQPLTDIRYSFSKLEYNSKWGSIAERSSNQGRRNKEAQVNKNRKSTCKEAFTRKTGDMPKTQVCLKASSSQNLKKISEANTQSSNNCSLLMQPGDQKSRTSLSGGSNKKSVKNFPMPCGQYKVWTNGKIVDNCKRPKLTNAANQYRSQLHTEAETCICIEEMRADPFLPYKGHPPSPLSPYSVWWTQRLENPCDDCPRVEEQYLEQQQTSSPYDTEANVFMQSEEIELQSTYESASGKPYREKCTCSSPKIIPGLLNSGAQSDSRAKSSQAQPHFCSYCGNPISTHPGSSPGSNSFEHTCSKCRMSGIQPSRNPSNSYAQRQTNCPRVEVDQCDNYKQTKMPTFCKRTGFDPEITHPQPICRPESSKKSGKKQRVTESTLGCKLYKLRDLYSQEQLSPCSQSEKCVQDSSCAQPEATRSPLAFCSTQEPLASCYQPSKKFSAKPKKNETTLGYKPPPVYAQGKPVPCTISAKYVQPAVRIRAKTNQTQPECKTTAQAPKVFCPNTFKRSDKPLPNENQLGCKQLPGYSLRDESASRSYSAKYVQAAICICPPKTTRPESSDDSKLGARKPQIWSPQEKCVQPTIPMPTKTTQSWPEPRQESPTCKPAQSIFCPQAFRKCDSKHKTSEAQLGYKQPFILPQEQPLLRDNSSKPSQSPISMPPKKTQSFLEACDDYRRRLQAPEESRPQTLKKPRYDHQIGETQFRQGPAGTSSREERVPPCCQQKTSKISQWQSSSRSMISAQAQLGSLFTSPIKTGSKRGISEAQLGYKAPNTDLQGQSGMCCTRVQDIQMRTSETKPPLRYESERNAQAQQNRKPSRVPQTQSDSFDQPNNEPQPNAPLRNHFQKQFQPCSEYCRCGDICKRPETIQNAQEICTCSNRFTQTTQQKSFDAQVQTPQSDLGQGQTCAYCGTPIQPSQSVSLNDSYSDEAYDEYLVTEMQAAYRPFDQNPQEQFPSLQKCNCGQNTTSQTQYHQDETYPQRSPVQPRDIPKDSYDEYSLNESVDQPFNSCEQPHCPLCKETQAPSACCIEFICDECLISHPNYWGVLAEALTSVQTCPLDKPWGC